MTSFRTYSSNVKSGAERERSHMYISDFSFVLSEIERVSRLDIREVMKAPFPENFASLPHPSGRGTMMCGLGAYRRLREMAERGLAHSIHAGMVETEAVFNALREITVQRFLREKRTLTSREADRAIAAAVKVAAREKRTLTHFVPCHLTSTKKPESFAIGPVLFRQNKQVMEHLEPKLKKYIETDEAHGTRAHRETLVVRTRDYYCSFGWIAEVTIVDCDTATSKRRASRTVQSALDCLHILLSAGYSNHMRAGGHNFSYDTRGHIQMDMAGGIGLAISVDWLSHHLGDEWWSSINSEGGDYLINLMGEAIEGGHSLPKPAPLGQRFLDSAAWYGEAVRDKFIASRIIKYVTAIERMLTTTNENVSESLASRGAALLHLPGMDDIEPLRQRFLQVYDLRSRLVHGSRSPLDQSFGPGLREAEELARSILMRGLQLFRGALKAPDISLRRLDELYDDVLNWAQKPASG